MAIWYITWGVLAYVMTLGKSNRQARDWVFTGQIVMLAVEVAIVTTPGGDGVLPSWFFPHMAEYEVRFCCGYQYRSQVAACFYFFLLGAAWVLTVPCFLAWLSRRIAEHEA